VELEIAQKRGADAQFPSRFEVKMNKREENSIYSVVSLGSRERRGGGDKGVLRSHGVRGQKCR
jgi:hypothetical protein